MKKLRRRVWELLQVAQPGDRASHVVDSFLLILIVLNVAAVIVESIPEVAARAHSGFHWFEIFSVAIFTIEYLGRLFACVADPRFADPILGRLRFFVRPMTLIDLLAILPFYLPLLGVDLRFMRVLRLSRILRVAKLARYLASLRMLARIFAEKKEDLVLAGVAMLFLLIGAASLMYFVEHEAQPDKFPSIPATMWWAVSTVTTVGYGDVVPITALGKLLGSLVAISGIAFFALPTAIIGSGFLGELEKRRRAICPHCGKDLQA